MKASSRMRFCWLLVLTALLGLSACSDTGSGGQHGGGALDAAYADTGVDGGASDAGRTCQDECDVVGQSECSTDGVRECVKQGGCLVWGAPTACPTGASCNDGHCQMSCPNQGCSVMGAKKCDGDGVSECVDANNDGCLEWSAPQACGNGETCSSGHCAIDCTDECTTAGAKQCDGNAVVECGNFDQDSCLEWGNSTDCSDQFCVNGRCESSCTDECSSSQARRCDGDGYQTCDDFDGDGCLEWGTTVSCNSGESCSNGFCAQTCTDECTTAGATQCDGDGVVTCGNHDSDSCLEWGSPVPCASGQVCSNGHCAQSCSDECTVAGAKDCDPSGGVITCGNYDSDSCLEWSNPVACTGSQVCSGGSCTLNCTDGCSTVGARQCVSGSTTDFEVCDDYNNDGCLEWGTAQSCSAGQVCSAGACAQTCTDECSTDGASACVDASSTHTCGNFDSDSCLEWGTTVHCSASQSCQSGSCVSNPAPTGLVISEVVYDAVGSDDDTFVEIHGPAGTDLTGVSLVGINGNGGSTYNEIQLAGTIGADGLFVVANPTASAAILGAADMTDAHADYQNGPDSIQLKFGSTVLDAVGYGSFGSSDVFAGEGSAAADVAAGHSLARDASYSDTDDNATDFVDVSTPTPGAPPSSGNPGGTGNSQPPTAAFTLTPSSSTKAIVDASASSDDQTPRSALEVRWDWTNDGTWDTAWSTTKTASHTYASSASVTVKMQVRDADGQTASATQTVDLTGTLQYVSGNIGTDTTWSGTIVMTNDVTVASGATLTIDPGTRVLVLHVEDDSDSYGDVALIINGTLDVNGTSADPVLFTPYEATQKHAGTWEGIENQGTFQSSGLLVEYAENGVRSTVDNQTIANVVARFNVRGFRGRGNNLNLQNLTLDGNEQGLSMACRWSTAYPGDCPTDYDSRTSATMSISNVTAVRNQLGLLIEAHDNDSISMLNVTATDNAQGMRVTSVGNGYASQTASVSLTRSTVSDNDGYGLYVSDDPQSKDTVLSTLSVTQSDLERNAVGLRVNIYSLGGSFEYNNVRQNRYLGALIEGSYRNGGWKAPTNNNITGNGADAGISTVSVTKDYTISSGYSQQFTWTTPANQSILAIYGDIINEQYTGNSVDMRVGGASGVAYLRDGFYQDVPNGSGGTERRYGYSPEYQFSDTLFLNLHTGGTVMPSVKLRDVVVWDPSASNMDVAAFGDLTLTGNYLGDPTTASARVFAAPTMTVDTTGLLSSAVSTAGR